MSAADSSEAEPLVDDVIERVLTTYGFIRSLSPSDLAQARERIGAYLAILWTAGQTDAHQLAVFGLAYLKEMHEGRDPRFSGC